MATNTNPTGDAQRITVQCSCGKRLSALPKHAGKQLKCPACGKAVIVRGSAPSLPAPRAAALIESESEGMSKNTLFGRLWVCLHSAAFSSWSGFSIHRNQRTIVAANAPMPQGANEPFDLKGDRLGMSLEEFKAKYIRKGDKKIQLESGSYVLGGVLFLGMKPWETAAGIVNCGITRYEGKTPTIAEVETTSLLYRFVDGKLFVIFVSFPHDGYTKIQEGMIAKHGNPKIRETNEYQNRFGAKFQRDTLTWKNKTSRIELIEMGEDLDTSSLMLSHLELIEIAGSRGPKATGKDL